MLLGSIPSTVLLAARRGKRVSLDGNDSWPTSAWNDHDSKILHNFYGPRWKNLLTPRVGPLMTKNIQSDSQEDSRFSGGAENDFGNLDDFDDLDIIIDKGEIEKSPSSYFDTSHGPTADRKRISSPEVDVVEDNSTVYSFISAYPEDTFADLRGKIYVATGIPPYRQHLFYPVDEESTRTHNTYRLSVEGNYMPIDVRNYGMRHTQLIAGVHIDPFLERHKNDLHIEALDSFKILNGEILRVFVADLEYVIGPNRRALGIAAADSFQFDLIYYGMILKYWPLLTPDAFQMIIHDNRKGALEDVYPQLEPSRIGMEHRLLLEQEIIDYTYARTPAIVKQYGHLLTYKKTHGHQRQVQGLAVTAAIVDVKPLSNNKVTGLQLNVRNIFDWLTTNYTVPVMVVRFNVRGNYSESLIRPGRQGINAVKRHYTSYGNDDTILLERFALRPLRRPSIAFAIRAGECMAQRCTHARSRLVFLTIREDGRYSAESNWSEDERLSFEEVMHELDVAICSLLSRINEMGSSALPLGGKLETLEVSERAARASMSSLTVSAFWPKALTSEGFKELKRRWRRYEKAGIVSILGLQHAGAYSYLFRKGVINYDPRAIERVVIVSKGEKALRTETTLQNTYTYYTDPAVAQRWAYLYGGRAVRIYHRTADLKIEMSGITRTEFDLIWRYMFVYLDSLVSGPNKLISGIIQPGERCMYDQKRGTSSLKCLQERDPDLYDLRKYDSGSTVYSVLCQNPRPPVMYTEVEAKTLPVARQKKLVKYWNFTEGIPAYYECRNKRYPHLSFLEGRHPMGYCLPCCQKTEALPKSKRSIVNKICTTKYKFTEEDADALLDKETASRHILSYGKKILPGRISNIPRQLAEGLFFDTIPSTHIYRLIGVEQSLPSIPDAGFYFALAEAINVSPDELGQALVDVVGVMEDTYETLDSGAAAVFNTANELKSAIIETFLAKQKTFTAFSPGGIAGNIWHTLLAELARIRYGVFTVLFIDDQGIGDVVFEASPMVVAALHDLAGKSILDLDIAVIFEVKGNVYPMVVMNQNENNIVRNFYSSAYAEDEMEDTMINALSDMIFHGSEIIGSGKQWDLTFIQTFTSNSEYTLETKLINLHDYCYGVIIKHRNEKIYIPVEYSAHYSTKIAAIYGPRPDDDYPPEALRKALIALNGAVKNSYGIVEPEATLISDKGIVGFISVGMSGRPGMYFYHNVSTKPLFKTLHNVQLPIAPELIDAAIYEAGRIHQAAGPLDETTIKASTALYNNYLYQLFIAEFAALLQSERNKKIRNELIDIIQKTQFNSASSISTFRKTITTIMNSTDVSSVLSLLAQTHSNNQKGSDIKQALESSINNTVFDFDQSILRRLRGLKPNEVLIELQKIMKPLITLSKETPVLGNMYVACSTKSNIARPQCKEKLIIPEDKYNNLLSILTADVLNPLKTTTLAIMTSGVIDELKFIERPGELVTLRI
jgi:hypothetical protein